MGMSMGRNMTGGNRGRVPSLRWRLAVAGVLAAVFLLADQLTKLAIRDAVAHGFTSADLVPGVVGLRYVENIGASFSIGEGLSPLFALFAVAVVCGSVAYLMRAPLVSRLEVIGLGMVAGGAIGNAIDRVALGFVTDFIATEFIEFPVFNIADIGITCGVAIAFIGFVVSPANRELAADTDRGGAGHGR